MSPAACRYLQSHLWLMTAFRKQTGLSLRLPRTSWGSIFNFQGVQSLGGETDISTNINSAEWFINTVSMWKVHWQNREGGDYFLPAPLPQWDRVIVEEVIPIYSGFWRAFWAVSWDTKTQKDMAGGWMVVEVSGWEGEEGSNVKGFRCWSRVRQMMRSHRRLQGVKRYG